VLLQIGMDRYFLGTPIPHIEILIPRLLLIGDFFQTPYALGGVEWTLRIELLYYLLMWCLMIMGAIKKAYFLPFLYILIIVSLYFIPSFPVLGFGFSGYVNCFSPFLFIGSAIYLYEQRKISAYLLILIIGITYYCFYDLAYTNEYFWRSSNSAIYAILIFIACWLLRKYFIFGKVFGLMASLSYSIYLLHDWLWNYLVKWIEEIGWMRFSSALQTFVTLISICIITHLTVEKYGNKVGEKLSTRFK
jgi:peptidoglycan/LPS O-acetylase OafA/YrhL